MKVVVLSARSPYWVDRSEAERRSIEQEHGPFDSAGEPYIASPVRVGRVEVPLVVTVLRSRGVPWNCWTRRPKFLAEGLATVDGVPTIIKFSMRHACVTST